MSTEHALPGQLNLPILSPLSREEQKQALYRAHLRAAHQRPLPNSPYPIPDYAHQTIPRSRVDLAEFYGNLLDGTYPMRTPRWAVPVLKELGVS